MKKCKNLVAATIASILLLMAVPVQGAEVSLKLQKETDHFVFWCNDQDVAVLDELIINLEGNYARITDDFGKEPRQKIRVNIYPDLKSYHTFGIRRPDAEDWVIGTGGNGQISMVSPLNPGPVHSYYSVISGCTAHEFTHALVDELFASNSNKIPGYLNEGIAAYEGREVQPMYLIDQDITSNSIPSLNKLASLTDAERVYAYGVAFVDFVVRNFGFDKIILLLQGNPKSTVLGDESILNEQWYSFLRNEYHTLPNQIALRAETEHFYVSSCNNFDSVVEQVSNDLEKVYNDVMGEASLPANCSKIPVYIYPNKAAMGCAVNLPLGWNASVTHDNDSIFIVSPKDASFTPYDDLLPEQLSEYLGDSIISDANRLPEVMKGVSLELGNDRLAGLPMETTSANLASLFVYSDNKQIQLFNAHGAELESDATVGTGCVLRLSSLSEKNEQTYEIIVQGDVTGNGKMNISQLVAVARCLTGESTLSGPYFAAADWNGDGKIDISDVIKEASLLNVA